MRNPWDPRTLIKVVWDDMRDSMGDYAFVKNGWRSIPRRDTKERSECPPENIEYNPEDWMGRKCGFSSNMSH